MTNYYEILGVEKTATKEQIKRAYLQQSKIHHPDKGGDADKFSELKTAFDVLYDAEKRAEYDETGAYIPKKDYDEMAVQALSGMFLEILDETDVPINILDAMSHKINLVISQHNDNIEKNAKRIKKLEAMVDRIKRKDDQDNFLSAAIKIKINDINNFTNRTHDALKLCNKMLDLCGTFMLESNALGFSQDIRPTSKWDSPQYYFGMSGIGQ